MVIFSVYFFLSLQDPGLDPKLRGALLMCVEDHNYWLQTLPGHQDKLICCGSGMSTNPLSLSMECHRCTMQEGGKGPVRIDLGAPVLGEGGAVAVNFEAFHQHRATHETVTVRPFCHPILLCRFL